MNLSLVVLATYLNPPTGKVTISYLDGDLPYAPISHETVVRAARSTAIKKMTLHCGLNSLGQPFAYASPPAQGEGICVGCVAQKLIDSQEEIWRLILARMPFT